jgi:predicted transcriptional regulator
MVGRKLFLHMPTIQELRSRRRSEGITLYELSTRSGIVPSRQSRLESGQLEASERDLRVITQSIDDIVATRAHLRKLAAENGLSLTGVGLHV